MRQNSIKILLIEDNPGDARLIQEMVAEEGANSYDLSWAKRLDAGLENLSSEAVDIVLLDLSLPDSHGFETIYRVREQAPRLPIIVLTGLDDEALAIQAVKHGAQDYLIKGKVDHNLLKRAILYAIERQNLLEELQKRETKYQDLAESISEVFFAMDSNLRCTYWNKASEKLTGISAEDAIGKMSSDIFPAIESAEAKKFYLQVLESNQAQIRETACRVGERDLFLEINAYPSKYGLSVFAKDISERKKAEEKLSIYSYRLEELVKNRTAAVMVANVELQKEVEERKQLEQQLLHAQKMEAIGRLAGGVAHDFNNVLTAIIGHSDLILMKSGLDPGLLRHAQEIRQSSDRAAALTSQLLAFSRKQVLKPRVINLNELVAEVEKMLRWLIGENTRLNTRLDPSLGGVLADHLQIEQVIMNMVLNARDAMPEGGEITIETANVELDQAYFNQHMNLNPGKYVELAVIDTGHGMDEETASHVFEPFFTTKEIGKGTGLGLSTVYGIVKQSGGHISVDSEYGKGTTFKIYLPLTDIKAEQIKNEEAASVAASLMGPETILIVEDDDLVRAITVEAVKENGYRVLEAEEALGALKLCKRHGSRIDLMLCDVVMPGMNGFELAEKIIDFCPDIKVLYMSGYTPDTILHRGIPRKGIAMLQKPFTPIHLLHKIREVLDSPPQ